MKISGIQKVTLLDYPQIVACTLFTSGCNLRCKFCHNMDLVLNASNNISINQDEIIQFLILRKNRLEGVCITGGEPLINDDIDLFIKRIKELGYKVKIDTNGCYPNQIEKLLKLKLIDMIAMDIKASFDNYENVVNVPINDITKDNIKKSISLIINSNINYEFRTTCVKGLHTKDDFYGIREMIKGSNKYFLQSFRKTDEMIDVPYKAFTIDELNEFKNIVSNYINHVEIRGI